MAQYLVISYFNTRIGPQELLEIARQTVPIPDPIDKISRGKISRQLDSVQNREFFTQSIDQYQTANYFFELPSLWARGGKELILLSYVDQQGTPSLEDMKGPLKDLSKEILKIPECYKAFYIADNTKKDTDKEKIYKNLQVICYDFMQNLPEAPMLAPQIQKKLFVWGLAQVGKTSILNRMKHNIFEETVLPTITQNIIKFVFSTLTLVCYDLPGQEKFRNLWKSFVSNSSLLIFVIDSVKPEIEENKAALAAILNNESIEIGAVPLLILANKQDLPNAISPEILAKELDVVNIKGRRTEIRGISAKSGKGVLEVLELIVQLVMD